MWFKTLCTVLYVYNLTAWTYRNVNVCWWIKITSVVQGQYTISRFLRHNKGSRVSPSLPFSVWKSLRAVPRHIYLVLFLRKWMMDVDERSYRLLLTHRMHSARTIPNIWYTLRFTASQEKALKLDFKSHCGNAAQLHMTWLEMTLLFHLKEW